MVPQGGNTGLVGGGTPYPSSSPFHAGVVLSLGRMNRILEIDRMGRTVRAEAGCVLETLDAACRVEAGLTMPIDLGAKGSCQLGGMLATNAGGIRFLRWGRACCLRRMRLISQIWIAAWKHAGDGGGAG